MIVDPVTGEYILDAHTRDARPNEFRNGPDARCAFCPGNEELTPPEIERTESPDGGWSVRVFSNKYPAVVPPEGVHEVIVDAPDHGREVSATAWAMWRRRYETAVRAHPHAVPVLFKNRGAYAGATLVHPHTQMIVLDRIPERWERMRATEGGCRWCADLTAARSAGTIVAENAEAVAYVRTSSRFSWSLTVLPRACEPSVDRAGRAPWTGVGVLVAAAAEGLLERWSREAAFNVVLPSDPSAAPGRFHWHAEVIPRLATLAGFELATGLFIRSAPAEESAERWRQLIALPHGSV